MTTNLAGIASDVPRLMSKVCAFIAKKTPFIVAPSFQNANLNINKSIGILRVDIADYKKAEVSE